VILGSHDFDGSRSPTFHDPFYPTFSVGVFQWVLRADKKHVKRGKMKVRITGFCCNPEPVHALAREVVRALDAGTYVGAKRVTIRTFTFTETPK